MKIIIRHIEKTAIGSRVVHNQRYRIMFTASINLMLNLIYALYNGILGVFTHSSWFVTICTYYIILSAMRFSSVLFERRKPNRQSDITEDFVMKLCGIMFIMLTVILAGSVYLSFKLDVAVSYHEIIMITIATYTFTKTTLAIVNVVKIRKKKSMLLTTIRNISCADAAVSMLSLQRSMLASFGDINSINSHMLNAALGAGVCLYIMISGISMISIAVKSKRKEC